MVKTEIEQIVSKLAKVLTAKGIHIDKIILYGSQVPGGNPRMDSDIDLAVISPDFGKDRFEEGKTLLQIAWRIDPRIEPIPISSESYENDTWVPLIYEIRQKGIILFTAQKFENV
ncbi:MAG: nucleotidyltransferase domain-containing protein [Candidatus Kuenenia sp.]|nr:nucleotidyltransferase domain-containing protein [Candidatus Kuenenia hertensis]